MNFTDFSHVIEGKFARYVRVDRRCHCKGSTVVYYSVPFNSLYIRYTELLSHRNESGEIKTLSVLLRIYLKC